MITPVRRQYESWPYPDIPLLAAVSPMHPWQLHCDYLWDRCGRGEAPARPRIWIAGCGTFQPYVFGVANPKAEILGTDISEHSLGIARRRCALHLVRNVEFAHCDLNDESTWPTGEFDLIECYGVLMNLKDPQATLRALGQRLSAHGVLRIMVYPQFSRSRVFQVQRLAKLCGFHAGERDHPRRLRKAVLSLPEAHPLRWAFTSYEDSKNDPGIVDAFLHAGDCGFTGLELGALIERAGLVPAFWFQKPRAQPAIMAERLGLGDATQSFVLHYLDVWQELRTNFVVCLRRAEVPSIAGRERPHPTFSSAASARQSLALARMGLVGGSVPTRVEGGTLHLDAADVRELARSDVRSDKKAEFKRHGLLLGGPPTDSALKPHADIGDNRLDVPLLRRGERAPNPFYAHLFAAFELSTRCDLPDLQKQAATWANHAAPLEKAPVSFGLTPLATYHRHRAEVDAHLAAPPEPSAAGWDDVTLDDDAAKLADSRAWLVAHRVPNQGLSNAELRELWSLLFSYPSLFLRIA